MSIKPLIILPDPLLRLVSKPVERVDAPLRKLADDMLDTMYDAPGIGLAAIQVGEPLRMLVIDLAKEGEPPAPQVFINPGDRRERRTSARSTRKAACRSRTIMPRSSARRTVRVKYLDRDGKPQEIEAEGLLATCLQHEIDHLNGVLFIDHISKLKRDMVVKKFKKLAKDGRQAGRRRRPDDGRCALVFMGTPDFAVPTLPSRRAPATRLPRSIPSRRGRPGGAAWSDGHRRCSARRERLGIPVLHAR